MTHDGHFAEDPPACHRCQTTMVRIVYGYPGGDMFEAAERGEIALGGCVMRECQAAWRCTSCHPRPARRPASDVSTVADAWAARSRRSYPRSEQ